MKRSEMDSLLSRMAIFHSSFISALEGFYLLYGNNKATIFLDCFHSLSGTPKSVTASVHALGTRLQICATEIGVDTDAQATGVAASVSHPTVQAIAGTVATAAGIAAVLTPEGNGSGTVAKLVALHYPSFRAKLRRSPNLGDCGVA